MDFSCRVLAGPPKFTERLAGALLAAPGRPQCGQHFNQQQTMQPTAQPCAADVARTLPAHHYPQFPRFT